MYRTFIFVLFNTYDTLVHRLDLMRDFDPGDVILWLLPHTGAGFDGAEVTTDLSKNKSRLIAARCGAAKEREITRVEREGTEVPQERGSFEDTPSLVFLFSHGARTSLGVVGGCAMDADFHISDMVGVSRYHLAITFDAQNRPILRDLGSTSGTKLTYNGEKGYRLSNFDWPLVGPSIANGRPPILNITDQIQFKVILPSRDYTSPGHIERVARFRAGTEDPENQLASLIIQSGQSTKLPSKQDTPSRSLDSHPQFYKEVIGKGSFGIVVYFWSFSDREEFVVKQPLPKLIKDRNFSETTWRKEADIMRSISHVRIALTTFSCQPEIVTNSRGLRSTLLHFGTRHSLLTQDWNLSMFKVARSTNIPYRPSRVRRYSANYLLLWNIFTAEILRSDTATSNLKIFSLLLNEKWVAST